MSYLVDSEDETENPSTTTTRPNGTIRTARTKTTANQEIELSAIKPTCMLEAEVEDNEDGDVK